MNLFQSLFSNVPALLLFVAGVVAAISSLILHHNQDALSKRLENAQKENNDRLQESLEISKQLSDSQQRNIDLAEKNASLSNEMRGRLTGGDTYLLLDSFDTESARFFSYRTIGEYPMVNTTLMIQDLDVFLSDLEQNTDFDDVLKKLKGKSLICKRHFNQISSGKAHGTMLDVKVPDIQVGETKRFLYTVIAVNGKYTGTLFLHLEDDGTLKQASHTTLPDGTRVFSPNDYPLLKADDIEPDWSKF